MTVMWESPTNHPGAVYFGREDQLDQRLGPITPRRLAGVSPFRHTNVVARFTNGVMVTKTNVVKGFVTNSYYIYQATLTNLQPGALYTYTAPRSPVCRACLLPLWAADVCAAQLAKIRLQQVLK